MLLQTNYGSRHQLQIAGVPIGRQITDLMPERHHEGSCIAVVATDAPLHPRQLRRLARRVDVGLARTGSVGNDGSGEIFLAFSTANRIPRSTPKAAYSIDVIVEGQFWTQGSPFDALFEAVAEATEEAALNALFQADTVVGRDGHVLHGLPIDRTLELIRGADPPRPSLTAMSQPPARATGREEFRLQTRCRSPSWSLALPEPSSTTFQTSVP